jgi:hypothetical protein
MDDAPRSKENWLSQSAGQSRQLSVLLEEIASAAH